MRAQLTVKIKTIFQEQEVNNAGIPLRVRISIVVSRLMHFKQGLLYWGAQWRRLACGGRVLQKFIFCVCVCNIHIKIKHWKVKGRFALSTEKDGLLLCQWTFSLQMWLTGWSSSSLFQPRFCLVFIFQHVSVFNLFLGPASSLGCTRITLPTQQSELQEAAFRRCCCSLVGPAAHQYCRVLK